MTSPTLRALGQVVLVYFAIGGSAVTAQDLQPGRATFAEMVAFARLASVPCKRLAPDVEGFHALVLQRLINHHSPRKRLPPKKRMLSGFEIVSGLADGASVMPAKWNKPVFSFRFYEGKISRLPLPSAFHRGLRRKSHPAGTGITGLAWTDVGGELLTIEAAIMSR